MKIVDAYTVSPDAIKQGDVMLFVVKATVVAPGKYRIYRCPWEYAGGDMPQGARIGNKYTERKIAEAVFPALSWVAEPDSCN